MKQPTLKH